MPKIRKKNYFPFQPLLIANLAISRQLGKHVQYDQYLHNLLLSEVSRLFKVNVLHYKPDVSCNFIIS